jgi:hypothetical protein
MKFTRKIGIAVSIVFLLMVGCATNPQQSKNYDVVVAVYKMTNVAITPDAVAGDAVAKQALSTLRQQDIEVGVAGNAGWGNIEVPASQAEHARKILHKMMSGLGSEAASTSFRVIDQ